MGSVILMCLHLFSGFDGQFQLYSFWVPKCSPYTIWFFALWQSICIGFTGLFHEFHDIDKHINRQEEIKTESYFPLPQSRIESRMEQIDNAFPM